MKRKVIVTCAVTGEGAVHPRYPAELEYPITPAQIAASAIDAARRGAAVVHLHARDPATGAGSRSPALYREIVDRIRGSGVDVVINLTCGHGATWFNDGPDELAPAAGSDVVPAAERVASIEECRPELCSLDVTTMNQVEDGRDYVYFNPAPTLRTMARRMHAAGVRPELEIFQPGDVLFARQLIEDGVLEPPPLFQFVLGVKWGTPATPEALLYLRSLLPPDANWTAFGISRQQMPMAALSIVLGGNVRVGLEDNVYLERGVFATNGQLVDRAVTLVETLGCTVATPAEAREILGVRSPTG